MEEWIVKIAKLEELAPLTYLDRDKRLSTFIKVWKLYSLFEGNGKNVK